MMLTPRVIVAAGIVGVAAACLMRGACVATPTERPDSYPVPEPLSEWHQKIDEGQQLDDDLERAMQRHEAKEAIVAEVIADRLTLLEAAAQFRDLNATWPRASHWLEQRYPGVSYELALCRQIIDQVCIELPQCDPERSDRIVTRLEAELQAHLKCETGLRWP
jgi:hypothetical protein